MHETKLNSIIKTYFMSNSQTFEFNADISQLMSLIINTFYSNKDIFLRELISNASDALDKIRFLSIQDPGLLSIEPNLQIQLIPDREAGTLTILDTGIGMTRNDLVSNLGTIAKSGTKSFIEAIQEGVTDCSMIGQFGVGFYSSFLVAERVVVHSKNNDDQQICWESDAGNNFTITEDFDYKRISRGTHIVLHLKKDQQVFLNDATLTDLVKKHSEYISFPIELSTTRTETKDITDDENEEDIEENDQRDDAPRVEDVTEESGYEKKTKPITETVHEWKRLNTQQPIWLRDTKDVTPDEYSTFYKSLSNDWEDHLAVKHFSVEGQLSFRSLLFVPRKAPFDLFEPDKKHNSVKLYVRRVFIMDDCTDILPKYLSFVKGVVDSEDLPLNISRETLQQNNILRSIKKNLTKKALDMLQSIAENEGDYKVFYSAFSKNLKLGIHEDATNRTKLSELLRYASTKSEITSLRQYVERMQEGQSVIYYITGESITAIEESPFLEQLKMRNLEVLCMIDPIDEYAMQQLKEYDGKKLVCATKEGLQLDMTEDEQKIQENQRVSFEPLTKKIQEILGNQVEKVVLSYRIIKSPCCLVTGEFGWTANMERIMKAQALRDTTMTSFMVSKRTLEINPNHIIISQLKEQHEQHENIQNAVFLLFDTAILSSGFSLDAPSLFANRIHTLLQKYMNDTMPNLAHSDIPDSAHSDTPDSAHSDIPDLEDLVHPCVD